MIGRVRCCGHVGCCDNSPDRHTTARSRKHADQPLIRSYDPGDRGWWCYPAELFFGVDRAPSAPSHP
jgi:hypothetical protein